MFIIIIEITTSFILVGKMGQKSNIWIGWENPVLSLYVLLQIDPEQFVINTKPIKELRDLNVILLVLEGHHIPAELSEKLLESWRVQIFFFKLCNIPQEYIQSNRNMMLIKSIFKHCFQEKVDFINRIKFLNISGVFLLAYPGEISEPSSLHIIVLVEII